MLLIERERERESYKFSLRVHAIHEHLVAGEPVLDLTARHGIIPLLVFPPINLGKAIVSPSFPWFFLVTVVLDSRSMVTEGNSSTVKTGRGGV